MWIFSFFLSYSKIHNSFKIQHLHPNLLVCKNSNQQLMKIEDVEQRHAVRPAIDPPQLYHLLSSGLKER